MRIILASKSPRRREILASLGLDFEIIVSECEEKVEDGLEPGQVVMSIAAQKGRAVSNSLREAGVDLSDTLIIACDTVVACAGEILGKPCDRADTVRMLRLLSGKDHSVLSGLYVEYNGNTAGAYEETYVRFSNLSEREIEWYADSGEPDDKAGAYAIQGYASMWVEKIDGCYFNVVGLPTSKLCRLLKAAFGIDVIDLIK